MTFLDIQGQRRQTAAALVGLIGLLAPVIAVSRLLQGADWIALSLAAVVVAGGAAGAWRGLADSPAVRATLGVLLMAQVSLLVAAFQGHAWQADMHMTYFAALAVLAGFCDWRTIAVATVAVALHHLALNFLLPAAVFPGAGSLGRVVVHAVILLVEAGVLILSTRNLDALFAGLEQRAEEASQALSAAETASLQASQAQAAKAETEIRSAAERAAVQAEQQAVVAALGSALEQLAGRDLSVRIDAVFPPEYEALRVNFNAAVESLAGTLTLVLDSAETLNASADQIAQASTDLSSRTETQAAGLEQSAAALNQLTVSVRRSADSSREAAGLVGAARGSAEASADVVRQATGAMAAIADSSRQIGQIIGVIDEIAFQTNLLALNAGVEAARAGDAGRGFAVVAQEVRALAQRSAEAAKEIKALINASTGQVSEGVRLVRATGQALEGIAEQVGRVSSLVGEMAASAQEQASGIAEVNAAVNQMDQMTQKNAAMVEESTAASHALRAEMGAMAAAVRHFDLGEASAMPNASRAFGNDPPRRRGHTGPSLAGFGHSAPANPALNKARARIQAFATGGRAAADDSWEEF